MLLYGRGTGRSQKAAGRSERTDRLLRKYATCRNLSDEEIEANIKAGKPYVLRLRSQGSPDKEIVFVDEIKGEVKLPENIHDIVLLKKDGIPTYHLPMRLMTI